MATARSWTIEPLDPCEPPAFAFEVRSGGPNTPPWPVARVIMEDDARLIAQAPDMSQLLEDLAAVELLAIESGADAKDVFQEFIDCARKLVPATETCGDCGASVWTLVGCPDGAEICRDCFEQGAH